jgi:hypothetical protein
MNKTRKLLAVLLSILFFSSLGVLYAVDTIYTPIIDVTGVQGYQLGGFTCNNTSPVVNTTISFTGYLLYNSQGIAGKLVILYNSTDGVTYTQCGNATTNSTGYWTVNYIFPIIGMMHFKGAFTPT